MTQNQSGLLIGRAEAKAARLRFYDLGTPCKNGHMARRYTSCGNCTACCAINIRKRYAEKPVEVRTTVKRWAINNRPKMRLIHKRAKQKALEKDRLLFWSKVAVNSARSRAKLKNLDFGLTVGYVRSLCTETCPALGCVLIYRNTGGGIAWNGAQLDRIRMSHGYVEGNVQVLSSRANYIKFNASADEVMRVALFLKETEVASRCAPSSV